MSDISSYYTISNVSKKLKVPTHVLRFWEKKFNFIKPKKNQTGRRYYSNQDIAKIFCPNITGKSGNESLWSEVEVASNMSAIFGARMVQT